jgi:hypothetical protein
MPSSGSYWLSSIVRAISLSKPRIFRSRLLNVHWKAIVAEHITHVRQLFKILKDDNAVHDLPAFVKFLSSISILISLSMDTLLRSIWLITFVSSGTNLALRSMPCFRHGCVLKA